MHICYTEVEVIDMAEFCLDCWNKMNKTNDPERKYFLSRELDLCEGCGEMKHVIIAGRGAFSWVREILANWSDRD